MGCDMRDFRDSKAMAQSLRQALSDKQVTVTHSESLELIARAFGFDNWNILAAKIEAEKPAARPAPASDANGKTYHCSFCGKTQHEVRRLIAGPSVFVCNECVGLCDGIMLEGEIGDRLAAVRAKRPDAEPLEIAREAFGDFSDERLGVCRKSFADALEHIEWGLRQTNQALDRKPGEAWRPDAYAEARGWKFDPMAERPREQVLAQKAELERRAAKTHEGADLIARILEERGVEAPKA